MTEKNPSNCNETKSNFFSWDIIKSDTISFFITKYSSISMNIFKNFQFYHYSETKQ